MLRAAAVSRIQQGMGFRTDLESAIIAALQEEQRELEMGDTLPKFLLNEDAALSLLQGDNEVDLPTDFLRRASTNVHYVPVYTTKTKDVPWRDFDEARVAYTGYNPGGPAVVSLRKSTLWFSPVADRDYDLVWSYYKRGLPLTTNIENVWLEDNNIPELLIGGAGVRVAMDARNKEALAIFGSMQAKAKKSIFSETVLQEAEDVMSMGGNN